MAVKRQKQNKQAVGGILEYLQRNMDEAMSIDAEEDKDLPDEGEGAEPELTRPKRRPKKIYR